MISVDADWLGVPDIMELSRDTRFLQGTKPQNISSTNVSETVNVLVQSIPAIGTDTLTTTNGAELASSIINVTATEF